MTGPSMGRRRLLGTALGLGALATLLGCGATAPTEPPRGARRIRYGTSHPSQFADLGLPAGNPTALVVLIHGGYWGAGFGLDLMEPLAADLNRAGFATWNLEYRRVGDEGGWPTTLEDVAAGIDLLSSDDAPAEVATLPVVLIGHSAGGQLAVWAASRNQQTPGGPGTTPIRGVISQAGVLDLVEGSRLGLGGGAVDALLGGTRSDVPDRYAAADPTLLVPASCPVVAVHGETDQIVPPSQSERYLEAATAAGGEARYVAVPGDHFAIIDPASAAWKRIRTELTALLD